MQILTTQNGNIVPSIGLGTAGLKENSFDEAIKEGYRLIDTSDDYANESFIGSHLQNIYKHGHVLREDLFLQTKISDNASVLNEPLTGVYFWKSSPFMSRHSVEEVIREKIQLSKRRLVTDYLDSVLLHFPYPDFFVEIWDVLSRIKNEENIRYIGVSNFSVRHFETLKKNGLPVPEINQTYFSPIGTRQEICDYCNKYKIVLMTYSPLMDYHSKRLEYPVFNDLEKKYNKTKSQIILRWNIERGSIPCPKSNHRDRLRENLGALDFELSKEDVERLSSLNIDYQYLPESKYCPGI